MVRIQCKRFMQLPKIGHIPTCTLACSMDSGPRPYTLISASPSLCIEGKAGIQTVERRAVNQKDLISASLTPCKEASARLYTSKSLICASLLLCLEVRAGNESNDSRGGALATGAL